MTVGRGHFGQINIGLIALAIGAGVAFLMVETKAASPLIRLGMFKAPVFATGIATSALISTVMMATLVVGPFYLSGALRLNPAILGIVLSAGPMVAALTGVPAGRFVDRFGPDRVSIAGLAVVMMGAGALTLIPLAFGVAGYVLPIMVMTGGYAVFQSANNSSMMMNALPDQRGVMSGMLNLSRNLGLVTGASVMGAVFAYGAGADVVTARPEAIAAGMRTAFAVAFMLVAIALGVTVRRRAATI
jgi:MFS family permease